MNIFSPNSASGNGSSSARRILRYERRLEFLITRKSTTIEGADSEE